MQRSVHNTQAKYCTNFSTLSFRVLSAELLELHGKTKSQQYTKISSLKHFRGGWWGCDAPLNLSHGFGVSPSRFILLVCAECLLAPLFPSLCHLQPLVPSSKIQLHSEETPGNNQALVPLCLLSPSLRSDDFHGKPFPLMNVLDKVCPTGLVSSVCRPDKVLCPGTALQLGCNACHGSRLNEAPIPPHPSARGLALT